MSTVISLVLAVPAAYAVTRYRTRPGRIFILLALVMRMVPAIVVGAPLIAIFHNLGMSDTSLALAIAQTTISLPLSIWLMASFFEAVPDELEESARVDGCSRLGALWRVVLPVTRGGVAVDRDLRLPRLVERLHLRAAADLGPGASRRRCRSRTSRASSAWTGAP